MIENKIGIIVGTNRDDSFTGIIAKYYEKQLKAKAQEVEIINLNNLPHDFAFSALYQNSGKHVAFNEFQNAIDSCNKLIFIVPEYNGSFPGVVKTFIDGLRHPDSLSNKKVCLVGVSSGVLGNAVGLGHLNDILSYLNANVLGLRIKLGMANKHFENGAFTNLTYQNFVDKQISVFLEF